MLRRLAVMLVLGSVVLAACGGGNDEAAPGAETGADGGTAAETGAGAGGETGGVGTIDAARCAEIAQAMGAAAAAAIPQGTGGTSDLGSSVAQLEAFAAAAPEEVRDDLQTVAEGYASFAQAFEDSGYDPASAQPPTAEQLAAITAAAEQLDSEEFQAAADRVSAYFEAGCVT